MDQTANPELLDKDRLGPIAGLEQLVEVTLLGLKQLAQQFEEMEQLAQRLEIDPAYNGLLSEVRVASIKTAGHLREMAMVPAVAKMACAIAKEQQ